MCQPPLPSRHHILHSGMPLGGLTTFGCSHMTRGPAGHPVRSTMHPSFSHSGAGWAHPHSLRKGPRMGQSWTAGPASKCDCPVGYKGVSGLKGRRLARAVQEQQLFLGVARHLQANSVWVVILWQRLQQHSAYRQEPERPLGCILCSAHL
jgi:hypothetical protein